MALEAFLGYWGMPEAGETPPDRPGSRIQGASDRAVDCKNTGGGPKKRKRITKPPRPTRMTWCAECGRSGLRWKPTDPVEEECRYCGGEVRVRHFPTLTQAQAGLDEHRKHHPLKAYSQEANT